MIARNRYRTATSSIRSLRPYFLPLVIGLLAVYIAFVAPAVVAPLIDDFTAFIITRAAVPIVQIILFMFFFYLILIPVTDTLREVQTSQLEILVSAPVKPSDLLLGEFMGVIPFYAIAITLITGTFTAFLNPLGLGIIQNAVIIITFVTILLSALWIGTVIAAILRTKLGKTVRGKDVGRALSVLLALPMIAVAYVIYGGGLLTVLTSSETRGMVRTILAVLPSSWGAEIFVSFASNPGNIAAVGLETLARLGGLIVFFAATLWLGTKAADRAYSLETVTFIAPKARPDGYFYKTVGYLGGGGSSGRLLVSIFKDYGRRLENSSWILYVAVLLAMLRIFTSDPVTKPEDALILLSAFGIPFLGAFVVGTVSRGRETIFIYKKAPFGIGKFVKARLLQSLLVAIPIAAALTAISTITVPQITLASLLVNTLLGSLRTLASVVLVLGLALINPIFTEESRERNLGIVINLMVVLFTTIGLEIGSTRLGLSFGKILPDLNQFTILLCDHLLLTAFFSLIGITLLYLGTRKLNGIE
ncbi:MAG: hypothetical protein ACE5L6_08460 [Candidatus Bathyarchaeia archaeon]